jgi:hypothetical protein
VGFKRVRSTIRRFSASERRTRGQRCVTQSISLLMSHRQASSQHRGRWKVQTVTKQELPLKKKAKKRPNFRNLCIGEWGMIALAPVNTQ